MAFVILFSGPVAAEERGIYLLEQAYPWKTDLEKSGLFLARKSDESAERLSGVGLYRLNPETGEIALVLSPAALAELLKDRSRPELIEFVESRSGNRAVLAVSYPADDSSPRGAEPKDLLLVDIEAKQGRVLVADGQDNRLCTLSPDGTHLLYYANLPDAPFRNQGGGDVLAATVILCDLESGKTRALRNPSSELLGIFLYQPHVAWSPDSKHVVFEHLHREGGKNDTTLYLYNIETEAIRPALAYPTGFKKAAFLDNKRFLAAWRTNIVIGTVDSDKIRTLVSYTEGSIKDVNVLEDAVEYNYWRNKTKTPKTIPLPPPDEN